MIRPFTCVCLLLAAGAGLYTYQAKHKAELLDREIARVLRLADAARSRSAVLRAEYQLLSEPSRLSSLAANHLPELRATEPRQFTTLAELDRRLPPVGSAAPAAPPVTEAPEPLPEPVPAPVPMASAEPPAAAPAPAPVLPVTPAAPLVIKPASTFAAPPVRTVAAAAVRTKPLVQKVAIVRPPKAEPFVTNIAAPTEALAKLAQSPTAVLPSAGIGGATVSALGMARSATLYPAR